MRCNSSPTPTNAVPTGVLDEELNAERERKQSLAAAHTIQSNFRGFVSRKREAVELSRKEAAAEEEAAVRIQAATRGRRDYKKYLARKEAKRKRAAKRAERKRLAEALKAAEKHAATKIQGVARARKARIETEERRRDEALAREEERGEEEGLEAKAEPPPPPAVLKDKETKPNNNNNNNTKAPFRPAGRGSRGSLKLGEAEFGFQA